MTISDDIVTPESEVAAVSATGQALRRRATVVVIGTGFGGQATAINLRRRGLDDFVMLERRDFVGGTWRQNSYPGAAVDVQSPLYSIAAEPWPWKRMFATQSELEEYTDHIVAKYRLAERTVLGAEVTGASWTGEEWEITTAAAGTFHAQFLVSASGPLSNPVIPDFPGRDTFGGEQFHTNDWNHGVALHGKRVAVVGSGASAAQVIPTIQPDVAELHVFQRSPHWVLPRPDREFSRRQRLLLRLPGVHRALRTAIYWSLEARIIAFKYSDVALKYGAERRARGHIEASISDPELRRKVTPDFTIGCKRIIVSNALYPALDAANCTLHDHTDGIDHLDDTGIVTASGEHLDLDVIVWSTGYDATDGLISFPVTGRDGRTLAEAWSEFPRAYIGTTVPGFPNFFIVTGPNTGIGHTSAIFVIESQMEYLMRAIDRVRDRGLRAIEVTTAAESEWTDMVHREMTKTVWHKGGCTSWYQSKSGKVIAMYPGFSFMFRRNARRFRPDHHQVR